jgi:hypothetical protein
VTQQTYLGYLFLGPLATNTPGSSTLNFPVGDNRAYGVSVALGSGGTPSVTYVADPGATTHVEFDVTGTSHRRAGERDQVIVPSTDHRDQRLASQRGGVYNRASTTQEGMSNHGYPRRRT